MTCISLGLIRILSCFGGVVTKPEKKLSFDLLASCSALLETFRFKDSDRKFWLNGKCSRYAYSVKKKTSSLPSKYN